MDESQAVDITMLGRPVGAIEQRIDSAVRRKLIAFEERIREMLSLDELTLSLTSITLSQPKRALEHVPSIASDKDFGTLSVFLDNKALMWVTDHYYDSSQNRCTKHNITQLTSSDFRIQDRILNGFIQDVFPSNYWFMELPARYRELNGPAALLELEVSYKDFRGTISITLHENYLERMNRELSDIDPHLNENIKRAVAKIPVTLSAHLWRNSMPLSAIRNLKLGDEIPISINEQVPVTIGAIELFKGAISEQSGRLILTINEIVEEI